MGGRREDNITRGIAIRALSTSWTLPEREDLPASSYGFLSVTMGRLTHALPPSFVSSTPSLHLAVVLMGKITVLFHLRIALGL